MFQFLQIHLLTFIISRTTTEQYFSRKKCVDQYTLFSGKQLIMSIGTLRTDIFSFGVSSKYC